MRPLPWPCSFGRSCTNVSGGQMPLLSSMIVLFSGNLSCQWLDLGLPAQVHGLCGAIDGRLSHLLPHWPRTGWRVWSAREKFLEIICHGRKLNPGYWEDRQWDILLLSYYEWLLVMVRMTSDGRTYFFRSFLHSLNSSWLSPLASAPDRVSWRSESLSFFIFSLSIMFWYPWKKWHQ